MAIQNDHVEHVNAKREDKHSYDSDRQYYIFVLALFAVYCRRTCAVSCEKWTSMCRIGEAPE